MVREQGIDPEAHWKSYRDTLDKLGIKLDSDVRVDSQVGQNQVVSEKPADDSKESNLVLAEGNEEFLS